MAIKWQWVFLLALCVGYFLIFSTLSILKHRSFNSTYLDLGLEVQSVWNTTQGRFLKVSFGESGEEISALSYHVSPIVAVFVPFYKLWSSVELLLIIQTLVLMLGAVPLYLLAVDFLKSRLLAYALVISYFLYPPLQWSNLSDFHPQTLSTTPLLFLFWFYYKKKWFWFYITLLFSLLIKENVSLLTAVFGFWMMVSSFNVGEVTARLVHYRSRHLMTRTSIAELLPRTAGSKGKVEIFSNRQVYKHSLLVILISIAWFLLSVYIIMPRLSGGQLGALGRYSYLGNTPGEILIKLITDPVGDLKILMVTAKLKYLFHLLVSSGFLSLLAPQYLLLALSEFFLNLFSSYNPQWQVKFHYTAAITPFIYIAAVFGLGRLRNVIDKSSLSLRSAFMAEKQSRWLAYASRDCRVRYLLAMTKIRVDLVLVFYLVIISILWNYVHSPSPLNRDFDSSVYKVTEADKKYEQVLSLLPENASVSAMNNIGAHLSSRRFLWRFPIGVDKADYIVVDPLLPGKNFDLSQIKEEDFMNIWSKLLTDQRYEIFYQSKNLFILKRLST